MPPAYQIQWTGNSQASWNCWNSVALMSNITASGCSLSELFKWQASWATCTRTPELGCNPVPTFLGVRPTEHNGTLYWVSILRIVLSGFWLGSYPFFYSFGFLHMSWWQYSCLIILLKSPGFISSSDSPPHSRPAWSACSSYLLTWRAGGLSSHALELCLSWLPAQSHISCELYICLTCKLTCLSPTCILLPQSCGVPGTLFSCDIISGVPWLRRICSKYRITVWGMLAGGY